MKNIDKNLKDLVTDIDSLLKEYDLGEYSIDRIDLTPMAMPIDDEFDKPTHYELKRLSKKRLKIEIVKPKEK